MKTTLKILKSERGVALMMALFTVVMLTMIASEVSYETNVEFLVSSQKVNQLKAYYAAKAGVELSLLRVHIYKKAVAQFGDMLPNKSMLDPIWQFPFAWPPPIPPDLTMADKDQIKDSIKKSAMQAQYVVTIQSEGSKLDINDVASPSKTIRDSIKKQLQQMFESKIEIDEDFAIKYRGYEFDKLVNNITDWIDEDTESLNGGDEKSAYQDNQNEHIPPNQPFKTLEELHQVALMTDDLFNLMAPRLTVYGIKGVNVNYASEDVLMSLSPQITEERAKEITKARNDPKRGPFKDIKDFEEFLQTIGVPANIFSQGKKPEEATVPLIFDAEYNFRIIATGKSGPVTKDIVAVTYDFDRVKDRLGEMLAKESPSPTPGATPAATPNTTTPPGVATPTPTPSASPGKKQIKAPTDRPNIIFWSEG